MIKQSPVLIGLLIAFGIAQDAGAERLQLDATSTSFFDDFRIVFEDDGDGLLQHDEIVYFSGVGGTSGPAVLDYTGVAWVPAIPGVSTASGTINPNLPCAGCWEFTPSNFGDVSDGWFTTRWTYAISPTAAPFVTTAPCVDDPNVDCATGISNLGIDGKVYDGEFVLDSYLGTYAERDPLFLGDAFAVANAVATALADADGIFGAVGRGSLRSEVRVPDADLGEFAILNLVGCFNIGPDGCGTWSNFAATLVEKVAVRDGPDLYAPYVRFRRVGAGMEVGFSGPLSLVLTDTGAGVYSGVPLGTEFSGVIDDRLFEGFITDGATETPFDCCIAAGGLDVINDEILDEETAGIFNALTGGNFKAGDIVDLIDLEGDAETASGGRIEVGLGYVLSPDAYADDNPANYPPDPDDVLLLGWFVFEESAAGDDVYSAFGLIESNVSTDQDGDGIENGIDGTFDGAFTDMSDQFSNDFTDQHRGGTTRGTIAFRGTDTVTVTDDAAGGVILAASGAGFSLAQMCGPLNIDIFNVLLTDGDAVGVTCGSLTAEVLRGPVEIEVGVNVRVIVPAGGKAFMEQLPGSQLSVTNLGAPGSPDIVVEDENGATPVGAGDPPLVVEVDDGSIAAPENLVGRAKPGAVNLTWSPVAGADGYDVFRAGVSGGPYAPVGSVGGNVFAESGLVAGQTYYYVVQAIAAGVSSENSAEAAVPVPAGRRR